MRFQVNLDELNPAQRSAVKHDQGPLLILAGAGSGKTKTMAYRIAYLIAERGVPAQRIVGLSFTNKAAGELKERVLTLLEKGGHKKAARGLVVSTFHSLCAKLLRQHARLLGFQENFSILDESDQKETLRQILKHVHVDDRRFDLDFLLAAFHRCKQLSFFNEGPRPHELFSESMKQLPTDYQEVLAVVLEKYPEQLVSLNSMDFDDLILNTVKLFREHPPIQASYAAFFQHLLVDEYQDTNSSQFEILRAFTTQHKNVCVVGDDDQSIYAWRGADASHILHFKQHYPQARVITLDQNYRSTSLILEAAHEVIAHNRVRHPKKLWSDLGPGEPLQEVVLEEETAEAEWVAEEMLREAEAKHKRWSDFAILYRSHPQARVFEEALRVRKIPYRLIGGYSFLERKEIRDVLAYWKLILNPQDESAFRRVVQWPARGIGKASLEALSEKAFQARTSLFEQIPLTHQLPSPKALSALLNLREHLLLLKERLAALVGPVTEEALRQWVDQGTALFGFQAALEAEEEPLIAAQKWQNLNTLFQSFSRWKGMDTESFSGEEKLRAYVQAMLLEKEEDDDSEVKDQVTLLTLHAAKGLEFFHVFLVGLEEGLLPHQRVIDEQASFDEERRLCYVGMTRAQRCLVLTRVKQRTKYGKKVARVPSRFLEEIPQTLKKGHDYSLHPESPSIDAKKAHEEKVSVFLSQIRNQLIRGKEFR